MGRLICACLHLNLGQLTLQTTIALPEVINFLLNISHATLQRALLDFSLVEEGLDPGLRLLILHGDILLRGQLSCQARDLGTKALHGLT